MDEYLLYIISRYRLTSLLRSPCDKRYLFNLEAYAKEAIHFNSYFEKWIFITDQDI